jgi:threonyl-tRNA synthetase
MSSQDHRELNQAHHYFAVSEEVGAGLPLWLPAGVILRDELEKLARELEFQGGYQRVVSPHLAKEELYVKSGHVPYYEESMFPAMKIDEAAYRLRPMCCPHHHLIFSSQPRSYRQLPLRLAEYGQVYRYERSGVLSGLMRARGLCQNDAHIYCREDQIKAEIAAVLAMYLKAYAVLGISEYRLRLSKGSAVSDKYVQNAGRWQWAENLLREVLIEGGHEFFEAEDEAAFYGPKIDVQIANIHGREETASTVQLDFLSAERFDLGFVNEKGEKERPFLIHRAPLGSHERMVALLIEKFQSRFPLWLSPLQVKVLPIAERHADYARSVEASLRQNFLRAEVDDRAEGLSRKLAEAHQQKVPVILVVGDKEMNGALVSVQWRGVKGQVPMPLEELIRDLAEKVRRRENSP